MRSICTYWPFTKVTCDPIGLILENALFDKIYSRNKRNVMEPHVQELNLDMFGQESHMKIVF